MSSARRRPTGVGGKRAQLEAPAIANDGPRLVTAHAEMEAAAKKVDALYARWVELEEKKGWV